ncbi:MAG: enolase C-terminal domain-like protein [Candidatus Paceibacterota bacterium]
MIIKEAEIKIILDSRGQETIEAELESKKGKKAKSSVPSGKSRSAYEAFVLNPQIAKNIFEKEVRKKITEREFLYQDEFDNFLIKLDGTENKKRLGGNLILALSLAFARLKAEEEGLELFEYINKVYQGAMHRISPTLPRMIFNMINGGSHADNNLEIQEFQVIPQHETIEEGLKAARRFYGELEEELRKKFEAGEIKLGDEAGFSAPIRGNEQAIKILKETAREFAFREKISFDLSLDAAASSFYKKDTAKYRINREELSAKELEEYYEYLIHKYGIIALEDPFYEDAFGEFAIINKRKGIYIVADDLTSTNPHRVKMAVDAGAADAIIIKPNQAGSLSETIEAAKIAHEAGWQLIISHRSGETEDDFIADLAVGLSAWGIKSGAPETKYRLNKYFRLMEIEKILNK